MLRSTVSPIEAAARLLGDESITITVTVHLTLLDAPLRSAFGGLENALRFSLEHVEEFAIAERAAECSPAP
jgi:hypothetical protein